MQVKSSQLPSQNVLFLGPATIFRNRLIILSNQIICKIGISFIYNIQMKNDRSIQGLQKRENSQPWQNVYTDGTKQTKLLPTCEQRLNGHHELSKKTKERLRQLEARKNNSPDFTKSKLAVESKSQLKLLPQSTKNVKGSQYVNTLSESSSSKLFKREAASKESPRELKSANKQLQKVSSSPKAQKKGPYLDSGQYKKLHDKLDSIQNKISDMKKNLQKKRQQKQKMLEKQINNKQRQNNYPPLERKTVTLNGLVTQVPEHKQLRSFHINPYSPRHNVYYVSQLVRAYLDQRSLAREHLVTSLSILKRLQKSKKMTEEELARCKLNLPKKSGYENKKTIIFDLDETLIHCNDTLNPPYDVKLPIKFPTGEFIEAAINVRPHCRQVLRNLSKHFQIIVFTASHSCYANVVIDYLDPNKQLIHHRLYRQHCYNQPGEGMYIKDLRIINRQVQEMVLVDNAAYSYAYQLGNGVPILPYYHGQVDFQLRVLESYLMQMVMCKDMRQVNEKTFKLHRYAEYYNAPQRLVEDLYHSQ